ncbi:MAG: hypothetical protein IT328_06570 [Caldilineaceae bacterium]|nr:hypothetical protein [Caldilineaceae bacterium]
MAMAFGRGSKKDTIRRWGMAALALWVVLAGVLLPQSARAAPPAQEYTYAECSQADEAAVQAEMTALAHSVLVEGSSGLEIDALVATTWRDSGADATFDTAVDAGIARIQAERGYWERLWSGWSAEKAEEFAGQVATYAFEDAALQAKLEELSTAIAAGLVVELESAAARSASSALLCLQSYVGENYSTTLFSAFQQSVSQGVEAELDLSESGAVEISPLEMHAKGLTGVGVIVATQITRRVAQSLAQKITGRLAGKIAGRVLGRLGSSVIPYIGWAVGVGLLVWDLWEGSQGALPTIRDALQAEEVKQEVRAEIAAAVREGVAAEVETLASTLSLTLVGQWQEFCANNGSVCQLAGENSAFRTLLNNMPVTDLTRLVQLVEFFQVELDAAQLARALDDGTVAKLIAAPPAADAILEWTGSPATTLAWLEVAGAELPRVVELRLYENIDPLQLTTLSLASLLAIEDNAIIHKLAMLPIDQLLVLLQLPSVDLEQIAATASPDELGWFAGYVQTLTSQEAAQVAQELAKGRVTIAALQAPPVVAASSGDGDSAPEGNAPGDKLSSDEARPAVGIVPEAIIALWQPYADNGVAVAAGLVVVLLVVAGMVLALRREMTDPPV